MNSTANLPLLAALACAGAAIVAMVDGRRAVAVAVIAASLALAPSAATVAGPAGALALLGMGAAAVFIGYLGGVAGRHLSGSDGIDPVVPIFAPPESLFGPRSIRAAGCALLLPAASWISFNIPVGVETAVSGLLFPAAYIFMCGALRVFVARTIEDVGTGLGAVGIATATAWLLRGGVSMTGAALLPALLAPLAALAIGWLSGRHAARGAVAS